jgi:hypothetical protein
MTSDEALDKVHERMPAVLHAASNTLNAMKDAGLATVVPFETAMESAISCAIRDVVGLKDAEVRVIDHIPPNGQGWGEVGFEIHFPKLKGGKGWA